MLVLRDFTSVGWVGPRSQTSIKLLQSQPRNPSPEGGWDWTVWEAVGFRVCWWPWGGGCGGSRHLPLRGNLCSWPQTGRLGLHMPRAGGCSLTRVSGHTFVLKEHGLMNDLKVFLLPAPGWSTAQRPSLPCGLCWSGPCSLAGRLD